MCGCTRPKKAKQLQATKRRRAARKLGDCPTAKRAAHPGWIYRTVRNPEAKSIASELDAAGFHGFGQAPAYKAESGSRCIAFGLQGERGGFTGEFFPAVQMEAGFFQEFGGESQIS